jgi:hypothetical protein
VEDRPRPADNHLQRSSSTPVSFRSGCRVCDAVDDQGMLPYRLTWEDAPLSTIHRPYYHFW